MNPRNIFAARAGIQPSVQAAVPGAPAAPPVMQSPIVRGPMMQAPPMPGQMKNPIVQGAPIVRAGNGMQTPVAAPAPGAPMQPPVNALRARMGGPIMAMPGMRY